MTSPLEVRDFQARLQRLEALLQEVERSADPTARARTQAIVQAVLDLHRTSLQRLLEHLAEARDAGRAVLDACAQDDLVGGLLLLHGLHPLDLETRVRQALDQVRPYLRSHGGSIELLEVSEACVRLRLEGSCHDSPSSAATMKQAIEEAILAKAPDVVRLEVEGTAGLPFRTLSLPLISDPSPSQAAARGT